MGAGNQKLDPQPRVVVLGGGSAGALAAKQLDEVCAVTLVDTKDFYEYTPSSVNVTVAPSRDAAAERFQAVTVLHTDYIKRGKVVVSHAVSVDHDWKVVSLANGQELPFDYLVIATGSEYRSPWKCPLDVSDAKQRLATIHAAWDQLKEAKSVLVIGGGPVGVEVASEVASVHPDAAVHLVHSQDRLLEREDAALSEKAAAWFLAHQNCHLYLGEKALPVDEKENPDAKTHKYKLSKSEQILEVDLVYVCIGQKPATQFLTANHAQHLDARGQIKVNRRLQLDGVPHVFAIGDCNDVKVEKMAKNAKPQAALAAANVIASASHRPLKELGGEPAGMIVSLGPDAAVMKYFVTITGCTSSASSLAGSIKKSVASSMVSSIRN